MVSIHSILSYSLAQFYFIFLLMYTNDQWSELFI
jgi:hypothetical protein